MTRKTSIAFFILLFVLGFPFKFYAQSQENNKVNISEDVNITIDAATSNENFEDIKAMLSEYGIVAAFSDITRNDKDQIIGLKIKLVGQSSQTTSQRNSNRPIKNLSFGRKDGNLYIGDDNGLPNMFSLFSDSNSFESPFESDSLHSRLSGFAAFDFFNDPNSIFLLQGDSLAIDQIRDKMMQNFNFKNSLSNRFSYLFDEDYNDKQQKYYFKDDPNKAKMIIIDGEISDFKTLSELANANKLDTIDSLSPKTAVSIYGEKAKHGAIIATIKQ